VTAGSTVGADEPSDDAIAQLARRHGLDPLTPSAATTQYLEQAIEHIARSYLIADPAELTERSGCTRRGSKGCWTTAAHQPSTIASMSSSAT
jgi:hypothetical protein